MDIHSPIRILVLAALLFPGIAQAGAADRSRTAFGEMPVAVDKVAERAALQIRIREYKARPHVPLAGVPSESLSECIQRLDTEQFINFDILGERAHWNPEIKVLHQPRVARVLLDAFDGTPEIREDILSGVIPIVRRLVDDYEKRVAGQETSGVRSENQGLAFPVILAEVDASGCSLPLLLAWYDLEATAARRSIDALTARGLDTSPIHSDGEARSQAMELIAPAALVILKNVRTSESVATGTTPKVPAWEPELEELLDTRRLFKPWENAFGPSLALAGYERLPELSSKQCNAVMQIVRKYLAGL